MYPPTMAKTFKYNATQQPMFSVIEPPALPYKTFQQKKTITTTTTFEDLSFSSYISTQDPIAQIASKNDNKCTMEDAELSIFDAQKYFSESNNDAKDVKQHQYQQQQQQQPHDSVSRLSSVSSVDGYGRNFRTRSFHATPTASSEASWNSQTGLLGNNRPGSVGVPLTNFSSDRRSIKNQNKWSFGRKCCCTGTKAVDIKEVVTTSDTSSQHRGPGAITTQNRYPKRSHQSVHKEKAMNEIMIHQTVTNPLKISPDSNSFATGDHAPRQQRVSASGRAFADGFSFPILNSPSQTATATNPPLIKMNRTIRTKPIIMNPLEDPPRDSLEVFQPIHHNNPGSPIRLTTNTNAHDDDDVRSDASSDLFEIESFSTQTTSYPMMFRRRDSLDEASTFNARRLNNINVNTNNNNNGIQYGRTSVDEPPTPSVAATECYAPSEISIDWSVTTAEVYDKASMANFSVSASEVGLMGQRIQEEEVMGKRNVSKGNGGGGGGGLLLMSCRHEKAVSVGPQPVKYGAGMDGGRPPRGVVHKPPTSVMGSSHSARMSLAFAA